MAHFHHHHYQRERQWRSWRSHLRDANLLLLADHNSILDTGRNASAPPPFEHPELLAARGHKLNVIQQVSLVDVHAAVHAAPLGKSASISKVSFPTAYTYGYANDGKLGHHGLRRMDKIYDSESIITAVDSVFATFVGKSNHKDVVPSMGPKTPPVTGTQRQFYCPTSLLKNVEMVRSMNHKVEEIQHLGTEWWDTAVAIIHSKALRFHATEPKQPKVEEAKLLLMSSAHKVPHNVYAILESRRCTPTSPSSAYFLRVHLYKLVEKDR